MQKYLYQLIKGLSTAEKRHFDLWTGRYGGDKQYLLVYKEICAMLSEGHSQQDEDPEHLLDEGALISRLADKGMDRGSFQDSNSYLYDLLLDSLRAQQQKDFAEYAIKILLQEAKLLERRGMQEAAMEKYQTALKEAEKIQHFTSMIEALKGIVVLGAQFDPKNYLQIIQSHLTDLESAANSQLEEALLFSLNYQSFTLVRTQKNATDTDRRQHINRIAQSVKQYTPSEEHFFSKIYHLSTKASLSILNKNREEVRNHYHAINKVWEDDSNKHLKAIYLNSYIIFLGNYLAYCIATEDFGHFHTFLKTLESIKTKHPDEEAELFQTLKYIKHYFYLNSGNLEAAAAMVPEIEAGLVKYAYKINQGRKRTLRYNMMLVSFGLLKYYDALDHLRHLYVKSPHREDLAITAKLFELIIQYKKRDHAALDSRIKSLTENLKYNQNLHDFERIVLRYLSRLIKNQQFLSLQPDKERAEASIIFKAFEEELTQFAKNEVEIPSGFPAILLWLTSEIQGKSFKALLSEKYNPSASASPGN